MNPPVYPTCMCRSWRSPARELIDLNSDAWANSGTNPPFLQCMEKGLKTLQNASRTVARREKTLRDHPPESDESSGHIDDHHQHHSTRSNGSDLGRDELMPLYRGGGDDIHPLYPPDMSASSTRSSYTPHRTFSTTSTTSTSYAPIPAVSQGPSHVLPPMHSQYDSSPQLPSIPSIESILHPTPVTTHC